MTMQRLSYISVPRVTPYKYCSLVDSFKENVKRSPEEEIAVHREPGDFRRVLSYTQLDTVATKLAKYLVKIGIKPGDNVAIIGPNTLEWIIGELGILMTGAVSVHLTINTKDTTGIWKLLTNVQCKALIIDSGVQNELQNVINALLSTFPSMTSRTTENNIVPFIIFLRPSEEHPNFPNLSDIENESDILTTLPAIYPEDTAVIFPTSGSTGEPKLIKHSHFSFVNVFEFVSSDSFTNKVKFYADRPFSWVGGYPLNRICNGLGLVFTDASLALKPDSTDVILDIMKTENCKRAQLFPYFLGDLVQNAENYKNEKWRLDCIITSGQVVDSYHTGVIGTFCEQFVNVYGTSETICLSIGQPISDRQMFETGNVGCPLPGMEVKIVSADGKPVEREILGRIFCRSRHTFKGYYQRDELTAEVLSNDGWLDTGDIGLMTQSGELVVKGRTNDMISRGTRKILPTNIEDIILKMPYVTKVSVIPVPDSRLYEDVCVCYVSDSTGTVSPSDLENFCKSQFFVEDSYDGLGDMPTYFLEFSDFPMLMSGKLDKKKLEEQAFDRLNFSRQQISE